MFPCSIKVKIMVRQAVPLQPMEVYGGADVHLQPREDPMPEQVDARRRLWPHGAPTLELAPGRSCGPVERGAHTGAGLLAGLVTPWGTHARAVHEELHPAGRTHAGAVRGGLSPVGGTPRWSRGRVWGVLPLRRKERQRQCVMNWPQPPFPVALRHSRRGGRENWEWSWAQEEGRGGGGRCFMVWFCFLLSYIDLIGNKLN